MIIIKLSVILDCIVLLLFYKMIDNNVVPCKVLDFPTILDASGS